LASEVSNELGPQTVPFWLRFTVVVVNLLLSGFQKARMGVISPNAVIWAAHGLGVDKISCLRYHKVNSFR